MLGDLGETVKWILRSGKHSVGSLDRDLHVKGAVEFDIFAEHEGRSYKHFNCFQRDRLEKLRASSLY